MSENFKEGIFCHSERECVHCAGAACLAERGGTQRQHDIFDFSDILLWKKLQM